MGAKTKSALAVSLLTGAVVWYGVTHISDPNTGHTMTRDQCKEQPSSNATASVKLTGKWGGGHPATISYSVEGKVTEPKDYPAPAWSMLVTARKCELIILHVTPTEGQGKTECFINKASKSGRDTYAEHEGGGPVQCAVWYENV